MPTIKPALLVSLPICALHSGRTEMFEVQRQLCEVFCRQNALVVHGNHILPLFAFCSPHDFCRMRERIDVPLPQFNPMPLAVMPVPFDHPDWLFEVKYDGFRSLAVCEGGPVRLVSRKRNAYKSLDNLCRSIAGSLTCNEVILDGEIVHLDAEGKPQFYDLLRRRSPQQFIAFDILWMNGKDLRARPLIERKRILPSVVPAKSSSVLYGFYRQRWHSSF